MLIGWRLISNCKKVNNVSVSCIYLIKLLILQRISNNNWRMKTVLQNFVTRMLLSLLWFVSIMLMFDACSPFPPTAPDVALPVSFATAGVSSEQLPFILADTITPPANPMAPEDLSSYPTYAGTLQIFAADAFNNLNGRYFCGIQLQTPIEIKLSDYETNCYSALYLLDNDSENLVQFDHPLLQSCVVGDTILVTGTPIQISDGIALGIAMRYVQPLHP
jgi:hypothetical protein